MPIILEGIDDITNFNHKLADTIVYIPSWKEWVYTRGIIPLKRSGGEYVLDLIQMSPDGNTATNTYITFNTKTFTIDIDLEKITPESGYYNHFINGEACFLHRNPVRNVKHTINARNSHIDNALWQLIPDGLSRDSNEIERVMATRTNVYQWVYILNSNKYLPFEEAVAITNSGEMMSCAFHKSFITSVNFTSHKNKGDLLLWYEQFPIGNIFIKDKIIKLDHELIYQEVIDILRNQNIQWRVNV